MTRSVCLSTASTLTSCGMPVGASSAVIMVTVSDGSDVPSSFSATILMWYAVAGLRLNTPASVASPGTKTLQIQLKINSNTYQTVEIPS